MKKRLLSQDICSAMVLAMLTGCAQDGDTNSTTATNAPETTTATGQEETEPAQPTTQEPDVKPEPSGDVPQDYKYYFSFDAEDDRVHLASQDKTAEPIVQATDDAPVYVDGVKGKALFLDGSKGGKLDVNGVGDKYTVSFWVYPMRSAQYMPTLQYGPDMHGDATGGQHYVNFTWAGWNPQDTSVLEYPCVWSYDELDEKKWPNFYPGTLTDLVKKWTNITLTVDPAELSADGTLINAHLYVNGEELIGKTNEGEDRPVYTVFNTMAASDNYDFLLGINYWDAIFKGAFDEIYIYDYVLDASQVKALYAAGNASATFTPPERIINVTEVEDAVYKLGATDFSKAEDIYDEVIPVSADDPTVVTLKHYSDGADTTHNYYFSFVDADGKEVARVNADATGTVGADKIADDAFTWTWGNWSTWEKDCMRDTDVKATIGYVDGKLSVKMENVDYNGTNNTATAEFAAENVAGFRIGNVSSFTNILSVGSAKYDPNIYYFYGVDGSSLTVDSEVVGAEDGSSAFFTEFTKTIAVPAGSSKTVNINVKTAGANNYNNVFIVLQNVAGVHSGVENKNYKEYAVVRADNFGWGSGFDNIATLDCDWDWNTMAADMAGAKVALTITNNETTADVEMVITTTDERVFHQTYKGIAIDGDLFFCAGVDGSCIELLGNTVGAEDGSSGFWSEFSEVYGVAPGTSAVSEFTVTKAGENNWNNVFVAITNAGYGQAATDRYPDYAEYAVLRADNYGWGNTYGTAVGETNIDFENGNMPGFMNGAKVVLTVTNNGETADIKYDITGSDGQTYYMYYTGLNVAH